MRRLLLLLCPLLLLLGGCGRNTGPDLARFAPAEEDRLVLYTSHKEELYGPIIREFEARTGIWVQVETGGTSALLERLEAEAEDPACDLLFGESSPLYQRLYSQGLVNSSFGGDFEQMPGVAFLYAGGESKEPQTVANELQKEADRLIREGFDEDYFQRTLRASFGSSLRGLNSFENIAVSLTEGYFHSYDPFRFPQVFETITKDDIASFLRENIAEENAVLSEIVPK